MPATASVTQVQAVPLALEEGYTPFLPCLLSSATLAPWQDHSLQILALRCVLGL